MNENIFISIGKAAKIIGVTTETLRNWDRSGKFKSIRTIGKHRRYNLKKIKTLTEE